MSCAAGMKNLMWLEKGHKVGVVKLWAWFVVVPDGWLYRLLVR